LTLEGERAFGKLRVVAEGLITLTENFRAMSPDDAVENPSWQGMVGFDYRTEELRQNHYLRLFVEYNFASGLDQPIQRDPLHFARRPFLYQVLARAHYDWGVNLDLSIDVASSPTRYDVMVAPHVRYTVRDVLTVGARGVLLRGHPTDSFYGAFAENSRVETSLELRF
jgi:hypothetical protein